MQILHFWQWLLSTKTKWSSKLKSCTEAAEAVTFVNVCIILAHVDSPGYLHLYLLLISLSLIYSVFLYLPSINYPDTT